MVVVLILLHYSEFPNPRWPLALFAGMGALSLLATVVARQFPIVAPFILVLGSVALLLATYSALSQVIPWLLPEDREWFLLAADRIWFRYTYEKAWQAWQNPWVSDFLQAIYTSFYGFPLIMGVYLYRRKDWWGLYNGVDRIMLGFLLSYCGYFLMPTRSPYGFIEYVEELPSFGVQPYLHGKLIAQSWTKRDCFPSGHTMMSFYVAVLAWQRARPVFWILGPWAFLTGIATLYLRYHYLIDVVAGLASCAILVFMGNWIFGSYSKANLPEETDPEMQVAR